MRYVEMGNIRLLTPHERHLLLQAPVSASLPIRFANGSTLARVAARCGRCHVAVPEQNFVGQIAQLNPQLYSIEAVAVCPTCAVVTPTYRRFHQDGAVSGYSATGHWRKWEKPQPGLLERLFSWLR